ncbi:MAG: Gmad2 immunoglobulin-like domain-containing protein [bacterium]|nr:Gmad2 immunoglobulin-like domain-containing protein [bacterium]
MRKALLVILIIVIGAMFVWLLKPWRTENIAPAVTTYQECIEAGGIAHELYPPQCLYNETFFELDVGNTVEKINEVVIDSPRPHEELTTTFIVQARARGTWLFEASASIEIIASDGTVLLQDYIMTSDEWMTTDLVNLSREFTFDPRGYTTGVFVFHKANPSGLPENDDSVRFPIRFRK